VTGVSAHAGTGIRSRHCRLVAGAVAVVCGLDDADVGPDTRLVDDLGLDWADLPVILRDLRWAPGRAIDVAAVVARAARLGDDALAQLTVTSLAELLDPEFGW
jgi:hypothetical protein